MALVAFSRVVLTDIGMPGWIDDLATLRRLRNGSDTAARFREVYKMKDEGQREQLLTELAELRQKVTELEASEAERERAEDLLHIQRDLAVTLGSTSDLAEILNRILEAAFHVEGIDCGGVYLVDRHTGELDLVSHEGLPPEFTESASHYDAGSPRARLVMAGKPVYQSYLETVRSIGATLDEARQREGLRAVAVIPVLHEGQVVASLNFASHTHDEIPVGARNVLEAIAAQIGGIVARVRAEEVLQTAYDELEGRVAARTAELAKANEELRGEIAERKRTEEALKQRLEQLAGLNRASQAVTASLDLDQVLAEIVSLAGRVVASDYAGVVLVDEGGRLRRSAEYLPGVPDIERRIRDEGFTRWIVRSGQAVVVDDVGENGAVNPRPADGQSPELVEGAPRTANPPVVEAGVKSFVGLPLVARDRLLGVLYLHSLRPGNFRDRFPLLTTFANQMALAIENTRVYEMERKRVTQLELVGEITRKVASILDLDELLPQVAYLIGDAFGYHKVNVFLLEAGSYECILGAGNGPFEAQIGRLRIKIGREEGIAGWVARSGEPLLVGDVSREPGYSSSEELRDTRSELAVPVKLKGEVIGVLDVQSVEHDAFDEDDAFVLQTLADQIAVAIGNARLHQEVQRRVEELTYLNRVGRTMTSSLDLEQVLTTVMEETAHVLGTEAGSVSLLDDDSGQLVFEAAVGPRSEEVKGLRLPLGQGIAGWVAREGQRLLVPDVREDPRFYPGIDEITGFVTRSVLAVPLKVRGKVTGVIEAVNKAEGYFDQTDVALLSSMARWAATAIENARLFERVEQSERRYRNVLESSADAIVSLDPDLRIASWSVGAERIFGYAREEIIGQPLDVLVPEHDRQPAAKRLEEVRQRGFVRGWETQWRARDGRLVEVEMTVSDLGPELGVTTVMRDITERKRAERLLRALNQAATAMEGALTPEEIFTAVAGELKELGLSCAVFLMDESQSRLFPKHLSYETGAIRAAEKLVGLRVEDFSIPIEAVDIYRGAIREKKTSFLENAAENIMRQVLPEPVKRLAGQIARMLKIPKSISGPLIVGDQVIGVLSVQSDDLSEEDIPTVTAFAHQIAAAWRKAQLMQDLQNSLEELKRTQAQLVRSAKLAAIGELAAGVAHELNNPLASIMGFTHLLLQGVDDDDPKKRDLEIIDREAARTKSIVRGLLDFAHQAEPRLEPADVNGVVRSALPLVQHQAKITKVTIEESYDETLPLVSLDADQMKQVFLNVMTNAIQAMPEGGELKVVTACRPQAQSPGLVEGIEGADCVTVEFHDTGVGISAEDLPRIFDPFFTTKEVGRGTGLGLSISRSIVERHGGWIEVESEVGRGSTFTVMLPLREA